MEVRARGLRMLGRVSMYRLVLLALATIAVVAFAVSFTGTIVPTPGALVVSAAVLVAGAVLTDILGHRLLQRTRRLESGLITALILLFVLGPRIDALGLLWLFVAAVVGTASKYLIAWRGRHLLNPAAFGAAAVTVSGLTGSLWWVGTPILAVFVVLFGVLVAWRADELGLVALFLMIAAPLSYLQNFLLTQQFDLAFDPVGTIRTVLISSPLLFLAFFMVTEPLTLPGRAHQRRIVVVIAAVLAGWTFSFGTFFIRPELALLVANIAAFALSFAERRVTAFTLVARRPVTPTVTELVLRPSAPLSARPGQYVELEVPHLLADARGTRREFSLMRAAPEHRAAHGPEAAADVRVAYRVATSGAVSTFKQAAAGLTPGDVVRTTGVRGDFLLPADASAPVLMIAAGIGVTPFVAMLATAQSRGGEAGRDAVLVLVASSAAELAYRDELEASGVPVVVVTPDEPERLPPHWRWLGGRRLDAVALLSAVPDLGARHAYVSGPPALIADLLPALRTAPTIRTDAFAGY